MSQPRAQLKSQVNGHTAMNGSAVAPAPPAAPASVDASGLPWEHSIINEVPFEDLTRRICDWIFLTIGDAETPSGGAVFEIEAKIGDIFDIEEGRRLKLPHIVTETIFNKDVFRKTKFESSMNMVRIHKSNPHFHFHRNATNRRLST